MNRLHSIRWFVVVLGIGLIATGAFAQEQKTEEYEPQVGQQGKDVVWVPTQQDLVELMLDLAKVTPEDYVIDLGSGDGRTVIAAAKRGIPALGIEYNPDLVELSIRNAAKEGVSDKASFVTADIFESDFSKATVITLFLLPNLNIKLRPKLLDMKPGTRVVSNTFTMEDWKADDTIRIEGNCCTWCVAHLWIIPAKVEGKWRLPEGELSISQQFQMITGTLKTGGKDIPISGRLTGDKISFTADATEYKGQVVGDTISGIAKSYSGNNEWNAILEK